MDMETRDNRTANPADEYFALEENGNLVISGDPITIDDDEKKKQDNVEQEIPAANDPGEVSADDEEPEQEEPIEQMEPTGEEEETEEVKPYTPEELDATDFDNVDIHRLPPELKAVYNRMRAGFGKKMEELAEERKAIQEELRRLREELAARQAPQPPVNRLSFARQISEYAKQQACEMLGISPEDFDPFDVTHQATLQLATNRLYDTYKENLRRQQEEELRQQQLREAEEQKRREFDALVDSYRKKEPNFKKIYNYFPEWANNMPAYQRDQMQAEFAKGNIEGLKKWFDKCRADWYAKNKKPEPPQVERSGASVGQQSQPKRVSADKFGSMTPEEKVKFLLEWGYAD